MIHSPDTVKYYTSAGFSISYFLLIIIAAVFFFRVHKRYELTKQNISQIKWIGVSFVLFLLVNPIVNYLVPLSSDLQTYLMEAHLYYPLFYYSSSSIKIVDIVFQQILIFAFLKKVKYLTQDKRVSMVIFAICFFSLHLPLIYMFKWAAFAFLIPCLFAGLIFAYFNFYHKKYGVLWSFCVHEAFYIAMGVGFRLLY